MPPGTRPNDEISRLADAILVGQRKEEVSVAAAGTVQSISKTHGRLLSLVRGADELTVEILPHVVEREAFHQLKRGSATVEQVAASSSGIAGWAASPQTAQHEAETAGWLWPWDFQKHP